MSQHLSFNTLQEAAVARSKNFRNARGGLARNEGEEWSPERWTLATLGELGEFANLLKKVVRGDFNASLEDLKKASTSTDSTTASKVKTELAKELADTAIYLALLADSLNIDLGHAIELKFNERSMKMPPPRIMIFEDGYYTDPEGDEEE